jgi:hypothetical protein
MRPITLAVVLAGAVLVSGGLSAQAGKKVTVTGNVVDAACFMIHPQAATVASHKECGDACVARGVPLAIVNEADGQIYFAADGGKQIGPFHHKRVTATGTSVRKDEPMELKMAVGEKNEMAVKVTGGYNVLTIDTLAAAAPKR